MVWTELEAAASAVSVPQRREYDLGIQLCHLTVRMQLAQAVLVPLLVDKDNVGPSGLKAITGMMTMRPTPDFDVSAPLRSNVDLPRTTHADVKCSIALWDAHQQHIPYR